MRITTRLIVALVFAASIVVAVSTYLQIRSERGRLLEDLERRSSILAETLQEIVTPSLAAQDRKKLKQIVEKYGTREHLISIALFDPKGEVLASAPALESDLTSINDMVGQALKQGSPAIGLLREKHISVVPLQQGETVLGALVLARDASFIETRLSGMWQHNFFRLLFHALLIALVSLLIVRWTVLAPIDKMASWMKNIRISGAADIPEFSTSHPLAPLAREAADLAKSFAAAKRAAEHEAKLRTLGESVWTPAKLREHALSKLKGKPLIIVANREPYMHVRAGKKIECIVPASGLVTGVEPILRACGGIWVAHGGGDADRETADAQGRLKVPPDNPQYTLRRVWLTKEEEDGYYYGFSNEGLWPLCHIAHTRPIFRVEDWAHYQKANQKFAEAVAEEIEDQQEPCVLIQDYHFALLPKLIKEKRPDARVAIFWHIPWPNPEAFGICPWQRELLQGMLGADLIGFHTQFNCNNFLDTVDRMLQSRINWERFSVRFGEQTSEVKPFPISVDFQEPQGPPTSPAARESEKQRLLKELGVTGKYLGVGVDRLDYTKGILERFRSVERFLEKNPQYQGQFVLVEIGAPSRTHIKRYHDFINEIEAEADRINWRFKNKDYKPIVLLAKHHSHADILPYYKSADVCLVTSLHDGMNLVAKEFVAARDDLRGVLILSRFTGAARELRDALVINPYDFEQTADTIRSSLEMEEAEQGERMRAMRQTLRENNVYRWAADLISELTRIRLEHKPITRTL